MNNDARVELVRSLLVAHYAATAHYMNDKGMGVRLFWPRGFVKPRVVYGEG